MKCPQCSYALAENATRCDCGWRRKGGDALVDEVDSAGRERRCAHRDDEGERCRNTASWFPGASKIGYCSAHSRETAVPVRCPPEVKAKIDRFLSRANVTPGRMREPAPMRDPGSDEGEEG